MQIPVVDLNGQKTETIDLDDARWSSPANLRLLSQAIHMYRSNQRAGTASTKTRGDVSGGGKKPWKQKHTGRARAGSIRSPLWRHGGVVFGPHPKDFGYKLPKAILRAALLESLKGKLHDEELVIVTELRATEPKTKPFAGMAKTFGVERLSLIVLEDLQDALVKSLRNLPAFSLRRADELNAHDVLNAHKVVLTKMAFGRVQDRLDGKRLEPILSGASTSSVPRPPRVVEPKATIRKSEASKARAKAAKTTKAAAKKKSSSSKTSSKKKRPSR